MAEDIEALREVLARVEALADSSPDWSRKHLADLLAQFRPQLCSAAVKGDAEAFASSLGGLMMMLRRYVLSTSL